MKTVVIHVDGACLVNPWGKGGWAALISYAAPNGKEYTREFFGCSPSTTNNRMELQGAISALQFLREPCIVSLFSDSQYVIKGMNEWRHKWQRNGSKIGLGVNRLLRHKLPNNKKSKLSYVINEDLWQLLIQENKKHQITWTWVKGHDTNKGNIRCDFLANFAARRQVQSKTGSNLPIREIRAEVRRESVTAELQTTPCKSNVV